MDLLKQLGVLVEQATSDSNQEAPVPVYDKVLGIIQSRVDMYPPLTQAQAYPQRHLQATDHQAKTGALLLLRLARVPLFPVQFLDL